MSTTHELTGTSVEPRVNPLSAACDGDLLDAWRRDGCREALSAVIDRYSVLVLSVCRRSCRNRADADDAFQSTFLFLARSAGKIRHPEQLAGWLHRVAQRAAIATLELSNPKPGPAIDFPSDPCDPFDRLTQRHTAIVLDEELAKLPEHYRTAIVLHILQGESYWVLAEKWGTTVGAVRGRVQRGKQLLARRLRRRGIAPVIAFSAATHWTVTQADAGQAAATLVSDAAFPNDSVSPIEPTLLQQLLTQGSSTMAKSFIASSGILAFALLAFFLHDLSRPGQTSRAEGLVLVQQRQPAATEAEAELVQPVPVDASVSQAGSAVQQAGSGMQSMPVPLSPAGPQGVEPRQPRSSDTRPTSPVAAAALRALEREVELPSPVSLRQLPDLIRGLAEVPVRVDVRALAFADVDFADEIGFPKGKLPLHSALRQGLWHLGLRAVVDDEGIVITADPAVLVHRGIGVSRWINVDEEAERAIASKLAAKATFSFVEESLENALRIIAEEREMPILLDHKALEDTPYTPDIPVNLSLSEVSLRTFLDRMLPDLELTYTVQREILVITTPETAELYPLHRIYWLEGTGLTGGSGESLVNTIQSMIDPDSWDVGGGTSTLNIMTRGHDSRPAIIVSAPYSTHHQLENLFSATRESYFGPDPPFDAEDSNPSTPAGGGLGGMGGGGMGGGGTGGGFR